MSLRFRFAIASDLHIALPHTVPDHKTRFHRTELSIPIFEQVLDKLSHLELDFLLIPGDLTQDGEPENHQWLSERLADLPYPVYVVPGNHDILERDGNTCSIAAKEFSHYYSAFGYRHCDIPTGLYYSCCPVPGVTLIGLNSIFFDENGQQLNAGRLDVEQMQWVESTLEHCADPTVIVMIHHNVIEHLPGQSRSSLGQRYMLENASELITLLRTYGVKLIFTGHLHVQDVASLPLIPSHTSLEESEGKSDGSMGDRLYEITTGSLVTYPHPFRILDYGQLENGQATLKVETQKIRSAPGWEDLQTLSREFMAERSSRFMVRLLTDPPLNMSEEEAQKFLPGLRYFWPDITQGDATFRFAGLPPKAQAFLGRFGAQSPIDNNATLLL
ncbi:MAG: metallophosphoesterase [Leptolyngbyaceae bacterium]|nr:metallophosphoesterase [Leptolyngbyaceae bacterium]